MSNYGTKRELQEKNQGIVHSILLKNDYANQEKPLQPNQYTTKNA